MVSMDPENHTFITFAKLCENAECPEGKSGNGGVTKFVAWKGTQLAPR
jgi:hypothetical protein